MKKLLFIITLLFTALSATSSFAAIPTKELPNSYNFIQAAKFAPYFKVSGNQFFMYIDISTPKENSANIKVITPKDNPTYKPAKPKTNQQVWVMNTDGTKTPITTGSSFVTLGN